MYDGGKIIIGLILFVGLMAFPLWYNAGKPAYAKPELQKVTKAEFCVEPTEFMLAEHMQLLNEWRDAVVRNEDRLYVSSTLKEPVVMSLQNTCMDCHTSKAQFCDKCHDDLAVSPYCWDCHIPPQEKEVN
ncbi:MAG: sulfate reduction electron transfer complex DsrMKJOP subunit DsrJ [Desulfovibrionales bacterium]